MDMGLKEPHFKGHWGLFHLVSSGWGTRLTTHLHEQSSTSIPIACLHGVDEDNFTLLYYLLHKST
jgi:hypothetical protein